MYGSYGVHTRTRPVPLKRLAQSVARSALYGVLGGHYRTLDGAIAIILSYREENGAAVLTIEQVKATIPGILNGETGLETDRLIAKAWKESGNTI